MSQPTISLVFPKWDAGRSTDIKISSKHTLVIWNLPVPNQCRLEFPPSSPPLANSNFLLIRSCKGIGSILHHSFSDVWLKICAGCPQSIVEVVVFARCDFISQFILVHGTCNRSPLQDIGNEHWDMPLTCLLLNLSSLVKDMLYETVIPILCWPNKKNWHPVFFSAPVAADGTYIIDYIRDLNYNLTREFQVTLYLRKSVQSLRNKTCIQRT